MFLKKSKLKMEEAEEIYDYKKIANFVTERVNLYNKHFGNCIFKWCRRDISHIYRIEEKEVEQLMINVIDLLKNSNIRAEMKNHENIIGYSEYVFYSNTKGEGIK